MDIIVSKQFCGLTAVGMNVRQTLRTWDASQRLANVGVDCLHCVGAFSLARHLNAAQSHGVVLVIQILWLLILVNLWYLFLIWIWLLWILNFSFSEVGFLEKKFWRIRLRQELWLLDWVLEGLVRIQLCWALRILVHLEKLLNIHQVVLGNNWLEFLVIKTSIFAVSWLCCWNKLFHWISNVHRTVHFPLGWRTLLEAWNWIVSVHLVGLLDLRTDGLVHHVELFNAWIIDWFWRHIPINLLVESQQTLTLHCSRCLELVGG